MTSVIFKICTKPDWIVSEKSGRYAGSPDDVRDGFIHFSTLDQLQVTARKHFRGQSDLVLVAVVVDALGPELKWEPSRGGALFPHLYGHLPVAATRYVCALDLDPDGVPVLPGRSELSVLIKELTA